MLVAPILGAQLSASYARVSAQQLLFQNGYTKLNKRLVQRHGRRVFTGIFVNLTLPDEALKEHVGPYLLGTYELELEPVWREIFANEFSQIIDVGSKIGFYAVGLARQFPHAQVIAFDTDPYARSTTQKTATENGVANVTVRVWCDPHWLSTHLQDGALILSDCEGCERQLFCGEPIARLDTATLLIETHEMFAAGVTEQLIQRYQRTHDIQVIHSREKYELPTMPLEDFTDQEKLMLVDELRPPITWLYMTPRQRTPNSPA